MTPSTTKPPPLAWLADLFPPGPPLGDRGDRGLYGPQSAAWRLARERVLLAGGPAALLMQVAHPLVAAGVAEHSNFTADPLRRLRGTLDATLKVTFGDRRQVEAAVTRVAGRHRAVTGRLSRSTGRFPAGTPYRAHDPELAMWVFATLVWTAVTVVETFARPVPVAERDAYYQDMRQFGRLFGTDEAAMPGDYTALADYVDRTVRDVLVVDAVAHRLARQILAPDPPLVPAPLRRLPTVLAAGLVPPALREAYELPWRHRDRLSFAALQAVTRPVLRLLPPPVRFWPHYRTALRRVSGASR